MSRPVAAWSGSAAIWMAATTTAAMAKVDGDEGEAAAQPHQADRHEGEEEPLGVDDAGEEGAVGAGGDQDARPDGLEHDGVAQRTEPAESEAFLGHGVVGARSGQDHAVEDAGGGEDDERGDERRAARSGDGLRGVGRDARGGDHAVDGQQVEIGGVEQDIDAR